MAVTCTGEGRVLRAAISGEVDHHRARAIMEELSRQIDLELPRSLTLDLEGVTFMDSSGIGVLLNRYKQMKAGHTSFYGACPQVMRVLKVAGILGLMHQYESKEEAIYSREV